MDLPGYALGGFAVGEEPAQMHAGVAFSAPLLPKGTLIKVTAWHDNTTANKANPDPNVWVGYGDRTVDEMAHAWVNVTYMNDADYRAAIEEQVSRIVAELPLISSDCSARMRASLFACAATA